MCAAANKSRGEQPKTDQGFVTIRLEQTFRAHLQRLADTNERSLSGEIRHALRLYLKEAA